MKFYFNFPFKGIFLTKYLVMTQGEPVRALAEMAKRKFTSVADWREKSSTYQTRKTSGNSIKAENRQLKGVEGGKKVQMLSFVEKRGKGVRFRETRQKFKVHILGGSDKLVIFEGRYYLRGVWLGQSQTLAMAFNFGNLTLVYRS